MRRETLLSGATAASSQQKWSCGLVLESAGQHEGEALAVTRQFYICTKISPKYHRYQMAKDCTREASKRAPDVAVQTRAFAAETPATHTWLCRRTACALSVTALLAPLTCPSLIRDPYCHLVASACLLQYCFSLRYLQQGFASPQTANIKT